MRDREMENQPKPKPKRNQNQKWNEQSYSVHVVDNAVHSYWKFYILPQISWYIKKNQKHVIIIMRKNKFVAV